MSAATPSHPGRVVGKVAMVTGGGQGIGRAICLRLAEQGAAVAVIDIGPAGADDTVRAIQEAGGQGAPWVCNVTDEQAVASTVSEVCERFGGLDVLVNNAAIPGSQSPTHEATQEEFDAVFDVNVRGVFLCTKHALPRLMTRGGGSIVHISSISGLIGNADLPLYHATKGAVRLMAKTDAVVYARQGIRVNSVHPGSIRTPLSEAAAAEHPGGPDAYFAEFAALHPLGRQGEPDDIAYGVLYLASDESAFVTGSELVIDGGFTAQ